MTWPKVDADHLIVTAEEMASFEDQILSSGFPVEALMEKVGQAMAAWFRQHAELLENGVIVLIGPGHNGGDGLVVARELYLSGVRVRIWCPFHISKPLNAKYLAHARWIGITELKEPPNVGDKALWIDALFGVAQSRSLPEEIAKLLTLRQVVNPGGLVSLDIPSGISSDSGISFTGGAAFASFTLTVGLIKKGLVQDCAIPHVGRLERIDLGFPSHVFEELAKPLILGVMPSDLETVSWPEIGLTASKYQRGRVLVVAGSEKYRGAALLALKGAIASGAGSIQAALPKGVADSLWQVSPEVVLAAAFESSPDEIVLRDFFETYDLDRVDALLVGPGLGDREGNWSLVKEILADFDGLLVLDADALNRIAFSDEGWEWIKRRKSSTWITPHIGEFSRLFPTIKERSLLDAAIKAAEMSEASVLLKGAHTVIADPKGIAWQLLDTAPWVARTGLGDLLAGFVAGVGALAMASERGVSTEFLALAAFVHAEAAHRSTKGSSANVIGQSLEAMTKEIQSRHSHYR